MSLEMFCSQRHLRAETVKQGSLLVGVAAYHAQNWTSTCLQHPVCEQTRKQYSQ